MISLVTAFEVKRARCFIKAAENITGRIAPNINEGLIYYRKEEKLSLILLDAGISTSMKTKSQTKGCSEVRKKKH